MVKPVNTKAIEAATNREWQEWRSYLDEVGGATLDHNSIVQQVHGLMPVSAWWAQSIAVAYEQSIGRREPGQTADGLFSASISRTLDGLPQPLHDSWCQFASALHGIDGVEIAALPTSSVTPKWHYWRCKLVDESSAVISLQSKTENKVRFVVEHKKLASSADIERKKHAWSALIQACFHNA